MSATTASARQTTRERVGALPPGWLAVSAILMAALIWSSSFAVTKVTLNDVPPMTIGALRFTIAAIFLGLLVRARSASRILSSRERLRIGLAGFLGITVYFGLENVGVNLASASDATLIVASYPIIALGMELLLGRASFSRIRLTGMLLALLGVGLVVGMGKSESADTGHHLVGDAILLAGGVAWAGYNLLAQKDESGADAIVVTYYQTLAGAIGFVALSFTEVHAWRVPSGGSCLRILFLALLCSVAAFLAYNYGLTSLSPSVAVNLLNVVPVAGLGWAVLLAGESVGISQIVGGAVVIVGVSLGLAGNVDGRRSER